MDDPDAYVDGTWEADGGENAVILQPGDVTVTVAPLTTGPTLQEWETVPGQSLRQPRNAEYRVTLQRVDEAQLPDEDGEFPNKIGGTPRFLQGEEFPDTIQTWRLLLQLDSASVPFDINFGDVGVGYAFLNAPGTVGKFLWQCL